jgi:hypothetical protein
MVGAMVGAMVDDMVGAKRGTMSDIRALNDGLLWRYFILIS